MIEDHGFGENPWGSDPFGFSYGTKAVEECFVSATGDILFSSTSGWYFMPQGSKAAYLISSSGGRSNSGTGFLEVHFCNDSSRKEIIADLKRDEQGVITLTSGSETIGLVSLSSTEKETLTKALVKGDVSIVSMPQIWAIKHAYHLRGEDYIVVSENPVTFDGPRVFKGKLDCLKELKVEDVALANDGGTMIVFTTQGELYIPTPLHPELKATWKDQPLKKADTAVVSASIGQKDLRVQGMKPYKPAKPA